MKLRVDKKKEKKEEEKRNTIIPTIALKIVWKENKLPNCCIWDQKMFEIPKIFLFFYIEPLSISDLKDTAFDVGKHNNNATAKEGWADVVSVLYLLHQ